MNNDTQKDKFRFVEYSADAAERIGYSDYSYWKSVFQNFFKKKSAVVMAGVFFALVIFSFIALSIGKYNYSEAQIMANSSLALQSQTANSGLEQIIWAVITGVRYGMRLRFPLSWL